MICSLRLVLLAFVLTALPIAAVNTFASVSDISRFSSPASEDFVRYRQQTLWWQSGLFPRWNDTYVIVFEQEMLA